MTHSPPPAGPGRPLPSPPGEGEDDARRWGAPGHLAALVVIALSVTEPRTPVQTDDAD